MRRRSRRASSASRPPARGRPCRDRPSPAACARPGPSRRAPSKRLPGIDVGVVVELGHDDLVARAPGAPEGARQVIGERRHVLAERDLGRAAVQEVGQGLARAFEGGVGLDRATDTSSACSRCGEAGSRVIASATARGTCVPPGPSKYATGRPSCTRSRAGKRAANRLHVGGGSERRDRHGGSGEYQATDRGKWIRASLPRWIGGAVDASVRGRRGRDRAPPLRSRRRGARAAERARPELRARDRARRVRPEDRGRLGAPGEPRPSESGARLDRLASARAAGSPPRARLRREGDRPRPRSRRPPADLPSGNGPGRGPPASPRRSWRPRAAFSAGSTAASKGSPHFAARNRDLPWNPDRALDVIALHAAAVENPERREIVDHFVAEHGRAAAPALGRASPRRDSQRRQRPQRPRGPARGRRPRHRRNPRLRRHGRELDVRGGRRRHRLRGPRKTGPRGGGLRSHRRLPRGTAARGGGDRGPLDSRGDPAVHERLPLGAPPEDGAGESVPPRQRGARLEGARGDAPGSGAPRALPAPRRLRSRALSADAVDRELAARPPATDRAGRGRRTGKGRRLRPLRRQPRVRIAGRRDRHSANDGEALRRDALARGASSGSAATTKRGCSTSATPSPGIGASTRSGAPSTWPTTSSWSPVLPCSRPSRAGSTASATTPLGSTTARRSSSSTTPTADRGSTPSTATSREHRSPAGKRGTPSPGATRSARSGPRRKTATGLPTRIFRSSRTCSVRRETSPASRPRASARRGSRSAPTRTSFSADRLACGPQTTAPRGSSPSAAAASGLRFRSRIAGRSRSCAARVPGSTTRPAARISTWSTTSPTSGMAIPGSSAPARGRWPSSTPTPAISIPRSSAMPSG